MTHKRRPNRGLGKVLMIGGLAGAAKVAQAQDGFELVEALSVEPLNNGALRVATAEGFKVFASGDWAFANGQVLARPVTSVATTVAAAPSGLPWTTIGLATGGAALAGGAAYGGFQLLSPSSSSSSSTTQTTASTDTSTASLDSPIASSDDEAGASVEEESTGSTTYSSYITGDTLIDSLLSADEEHWLGEGNFNAPATVTYSFSNTGSALSEEQREDTQTIPTFFREQVRAQLDDIEAVANLTFVEVTDTGSFDTATGEGRGQINIVVTDDEIGNSYAVLPSGPEPWLKDTYGDIVFDAVLLEEGYWVDEYRGGEMILVHEILHALGLEHPFEGYLNAPSYIDTQFYTTLSYTEVHGDSYFPSAPMIADIAAIQHLYGANTNTNAGNDIYSFDSQRVYLGTIWDAGGVDTIEHTGDRDAVINLYAGQTSQVGSSPSESDVYSVETIGFSASDTIRNIDVEDESDGWAEITSDGKAFRLVHDPDTANQDGDGEMPFTVRLEDGTTEDYILDNSDIDVGMRNNLLIAPNVTIENAIGGRGDDLLIGNTVANVLTGGQGDDRLTGGAGADIFQFGASFDDDVINDFNIGEDRLFFSGISEGTARLSGGDTIITVSGHGTITLEDVDVTGLMGSDTLIA